MKIMTMAIRNSYWNFLKDIAVSAQAEESILMKTASYWPEPWPNIYFEHFPKIPNLSPNFDSTFTKQEHLAM